MITTSPTMTNLFLQLGLDSSEEGIAQFIKDHQLATTETVCEALFCTASQRTFICEQLTADAPWALVVDQLNESLHASATPSAG